jgi:hypothetical protein
VRTLAAALQKVAILCLLTLGVAGCITREPSPREIESKRFEPVADKAVVYLYRDRVDFIENTVSFTLDLQHQGASYRGTYFRFELAPGRHRLAGFAGDIGQLEFTAEAGKLYFIRHSVTRLRGIDLSFFQMVPPEYGRAAVLHYELN